MSASSKMQSMKRVRSSVPPGHTSSSQSSSAACVAARTSNVGTIAFDSSNEMRMYSAWDRVDDEWWPPLCCLERRAVHHHLCSSSTTSRCRRSLERASIASSMCSAASPCSQYGTSSVATLALRLVTCQLALVAWPSKPKEAAHLVSVSHLRSCWRAGGDAVEGEAAPSCSNTTIGYYAE